LAIFLSLSAASLTVVSRVSAIPSAAIVVITHGFAQNVTYTQQGHFIAINTTSSFTQDYPLIYAYFTAEFASVNVTWAWYDPTGQLFLNRTQDLQCPFTPCSFVYYFPLRNTAAATKYGLWTMTLQAGGVDLYSDHFSVIPVITQNVFWDFEITQALPPRAHGSVTVTIHPSNKTWSSYYVDLPFATNITAYEFASHHALGVTSDKTGRVVVNFGAARSDGYKFVVSFDLASDLWQVSGGVFLFYWYESGWATYNDGYHSIPGSFNVSLPTNATFLDIVGINSITFNTHVNESSSRSVVGLEQTLPAGQQLGWVMLYRDTSYGISQPTSTAPSPTAAALNTVLAKPVPFLPLTFGSLSLWTAVMSVFLLVGSELLAPAYGKMGVLIDRRRLRIAALTLTTVFIVVTAYEITLLQSMLPPVGR
jgi:hypothetical protein